MTHNVFAIPLIGNLPLGDCDVSALATDDASRGKPPAARRSRPADARSSTRPSATDQAAQAAPELRSEYIAGQENRLAGVAMASAMQSANQSRGSGYNPLVIHGPSGVGKTHLARGLAAYWQQDRARQQDHGRQQKLGDASAGQSSVSVVFVTGADFANLLKTAIDRRQGAQFRNRFRGASLLVLDDLTQLATRPVAQQELIHTLDAVIDAGGQVVITTRLAPEKIDSLASSLVSRLSAGLAVPLAPPAAAVRLALVERFAAIRRIHLPEAAARMLADGLAVTAPELSGAIVELHVQAELDTAGIDLSRVRQYLNDRQSRLRPNIRTIASLVAKYFGLKRTDLTGPSRRRAIPLARSIAVYLGRQLTNKSLQQLGAYFGGRDHTTILHSYQMIESRMRSDPAIRCAVVDLRAAIGATHA